MNKQKSEKIQELLKHAASLKRLGSIVRHPEYPTLVQLTSFLPDNASVSQRLWHITNNSECAATCKMCEHPTTWNKEKGGGYRVYCSSKCAHSDIDTIEATKSTNISRYGHATPMQEPTRKEEIKQGWIEKYGVDNPSKNKDVKRAISQSQIKRKNVHIPKRDQIEKLISDGLTQGQIGEVLGICQPRVSSLLTRLDMKTITSGSSIAQQELTAFIRHTYAGTIIEDDTSTIPPYQLDVLLPEKQLAIEVNGVFWHSELNGRHKNYHLQKTERCAENNIQLLHFYQHEWVHKQTIVKSMIKSRLGFSSRIHGRSCSVREISASVGDAFVNLHHIQGKRSAKYNYGLFYNNELIAVMTLSGHKRGYEVIRFCTHTGYTVVGGASKLFTRFIKDVNPSEVLSFADRRLGTGNVYQELGFAFQYNTPPNYWYFKVNGNVNNLFSRVKYQKHKLKSVLLDYREDESEWKNMVRNGFDRIWDCGSSTWIWKRDD